MNLKLYFSKQCKKIDRALASCLPGPGQCRAELRAAMRYAVLGSGKRIRPILTLESCRAVGGDERLALPAACAIELIHNYSLVHDDLPCMDDDDFRRGKPTVHKKFGEATALLAGDALLTLAFRVLNEAKGPSSSLAARRRLEAGRLLAQAAGTSGMVGGQAQDLAAGTKAKDLKTMRSINRLKTGALIAVSARIGAVFGGGNASQIRALEAYGRQLGLLFQIVDDILDTEGYARILGPARARQEADRTLQKTKKSLKPLGAKTRVLAEIADFVCNRGH